MRAHAHTVAAGRGSVECQAAKSAFLVTAAGVADSDKCHHRHVTWWCLRGVLKCEAKQLPEREKICSTQEGRKRMKRLRRRHAVSSFDW
jgi:hypothetical protein